MNLSTWMFFALTMLQGNPMQKSDMYVILLGTGTPIAQPEKSGPSVAVVVNNTVYIFDAGPGVVRQASRAFYSGVQALAMPNLSRVFITHLHSDHTLGLPDLFLSPAVLGRSGPLNVFGPKGIIAMTEKLKEAFCEDIDTRVNGAEHGNAKAYAMNVTEVHEGFVYEDENVTLESFRVNHGSWSEAYGYKIVNRVTHKSVVVSGDCTYSDNIIKYGKDCDILIHEVYSMEGLSQRPVAWKTYHSLFHTSSKQLADIANQIRPKKLVLIHQLVWSSTEENLLKEVQAGYDGIVINGKDLTVIHVGE